MTLAFIAVVFGLALLRPDPSQTLPGSIDKENFKIYP